MTAPTTEQPPAPRPCRHLQLNLKLLDTGHVQLTTPQARTFQATPRSPDQMWSAVRDAIRAATEAGQAVWSGGDPELAEGPRPTRPAVPREGVSWSKTAAARPDVAPTEEWIPLPDGSWLCPPTPAHPDGRRYTSPRVLGPVIARRERLGLPTTFEAAARHADSLVDSAAARTERFWERVESAGQPSRWHRSDRRNRQVAS